MRGDGDRDTSKFFLFGSSSKALSIPLEGFLSPPVQSIVSIMFPISCVCHSKSFCDLIFFVFFNIWLKNPNTTQRFSRKNKLTPDSYQQSKTMDHTQAYLDVQASAESSSASRSRGNWTKEEDQMLRDLVGQYGLKKWAVIATKLPSGRIGKQCRERWVNHLDVYVKKAPWTNEEDNVLIQGQKRLGNKWCAISKLLSGRPENAVKNRWNSIVNRLKHQQMREEEMITFSPPATTRVSQLLQASNTLSYSPENSSSGSEAAYSPQTVTTTPTATTLVTCDGAEEELLCAFKSLQRAKYEAMRSSPAKYVATEQQRLELEALEGICALKRMPADNTS